MITIAGYAPAGIPAEQEPEIVQEEEAPEQEPDKVIMLFKDSAFHFIRKYESNGRTVYEVVQVSAANTNNALAELSADLMVINDRSTRVVLLNSNNKELVIRVAQDGKIIY